MLDKSSSHSLRHLPAVDAVLRHPGVRTLIDERGRETIAGWIRDAITKLREDIRAGEVTGDRETLLDEVADRLAKQARQMDRTQLGPVINATGVILHTGLGRAPISHSARHAITETAGASNVEIDLETTKRHYRGHQLQPAWNTLTGCEDSLIVNNNAAATLLTLQSLCAGREVIISRGQLIEIGGSFRLPEILELSGAKLREVGTTNRTKLADYENAIGPETAAIMLVHPSNYRIIGFTTSPEIAELTELAHRHRLISIDDIGSGSLVDVTKFGLPPEPTFQESIAADADVVLGSGDKLLGGPQAGIILGKKTYVETIRQHPLARAVRVGKLTLAGLSATLDSYLRGTAEEEIPTLALLAASQDDLLHRAESIRKELEDIDNLEVEARSDMALVGGGSLPGVELPTAVLALSHRTIPAEEFAHALRVGSIRLFCRIHHDQVLIDFRSIEPRDDSRLALAIRLATSATPH
ncbi:MAG: L-seryl-tRNA(Sec) selenium transferase [Planctomycetaceae bacterium]